MNVERAEASMAVYHWRLRCMIVDIHVSRKEILELVTGITPCKEDRGYESSECCRADDGNAEDPVREEHREIRRTSQI